MPPKFEDADEGKTPAAQNLSPIRPWQKIWRLAWWVPVALAMLLYAGSLPGSYVLDDPIVITEHPQVRKGFWGIGRILQEDSFAHFFRAAGQERPFLTRYRPLSLVTFAAEAELFGLPDAASVAPGVRDPAAVDGADAAERAPPGVPWQPRVSRCINVLLFGLSTGLILLVLRRITNSEGIAWLAALLFAVHPIHVEVVANIKGRDEILSLVFILLTLAIALKPTWRSLQGAYSKRRMVLTGLLAGICFLLAMLSKEYAVVLFVFLPMAFFINGDLNNGRGRGALRVPKRQQVAALLGMGFGFAVYMAMRIHATGFGGGDSEVQVAILNNPYIDLSSMESLPTRLELAGLYLWRMLFPHPLSYDHSFLQFPLRTWTTPGVWLALIGLAGLSLVALALLVRRRAAALPWLFLLGFLAPVCGLLVDVGTPFSERLVYHASLGWVWGLAAFGVWLGSRWPALRWPLAGLCALVVIGFGTRTAVRSFEFQTEDTLYPAAARSVSYSPVVYNNAAAMRLKERDWEGGYELANKAVAIHKEYVDGRLNRSACSIMLGNFREAEADILEATRLFPANPVLPEYKRSLGLGMMLHAEKTLEADPQKAFEMLRDANFHFPNDPQLLGLLGQARNRVDQIKVPVADQTKGRELLEQAKALGKTDPRAALPLLQQAMKQFPGDAEITFYLGGAHFELNNMDQALPLILEARRLDPRRFTRWDGF